MSGKQKLDRASVNSSVQVVLLGVLVLVCGAIAAHLLPVWTTSRLISCYSKTS